MDKPLVSVIVAAYNVEVYLGDCLASVLAQDYENFEVLVVNDASTDNTISVIETYRKKDQRVHMICHPQNAGLSMVRNTGLDSAKGKYVLFVDGDDLIANNLLSEAVFCAEKYELDEVSFGYKTFTGEQEYLWQVCDTSKSNDDAINSIVTGKQMFVKLAEMSKKDNNKIAALTAWSWLYNKSFLEQNNLRFLNGIIHEDLLFGFQCCLYSKRVMMLRKKLYFYRKNTGSITTSWNKIRAKSFFAIISLIYADWIKNSFSEEENEAISKFLSCLMCLLKKAELCGEKEDIKINPGIDFGYRIFSDQLPYAFGYLKPAALESLDEALNVLVYGAGNAAADVFDQLGRKQIKIMGVIVSHRKGNPTFFGGVPVKTLEEWGLVEDATVVLAVTEKYSSGIESTLRKYGYQKIINIERR